MVAYAVEVGGGTVWAYASRSRMAHSLRATPDDFWIGNMIPIPIPIPIPSPSPSPSSSTDDLDVARARNRHERPLAGRLHTLRPQRTRPRTPGCLV